jgi:hypothetical protein
MKKLAFLFAFSALWILADTADSPEILEASARSRRPPNCSQFNIDPKASRSLRPVTLPPSESDCRTRILNGSPIPDPNCTPGAINPSVTADVLRDPAFHTACVRQQVTTEHEKAQTYRWYSISHPANNSGGAQSCELDHLVSLELGGPDTLENIWPQCGPPGLPLDERYFKQKDLVENYLAWRVRRSQMDLAQAQRDCDELDAIPLGSETALHIAWMPVRAALEKSSFDRLNGIMLDSAPRRPFPPCLVNS